jgi:hypothetical protein
MDRERKRRTKPREQPAKSQEPNAATEKRVREKQ